MASPACPRCEAPALVLVAWAKSPAGSNVGIECESCGLLQSVSDGRLIQAAILSYEDEQSNNEDT